MRNKDAIIKKAHTLIKQHEEADKEHAKLINDWSLDIKNAKSANERTKIDSKYGKLDTVLEKRVDKLYNAYYKFMHKNFKNIKHEDYAGLPNGFMDKKLVINLCNKKV